MDDNELTWWNAMIATATNSVIRQPRFRGHVEVDDVQAVLWEWVIRHQSGKIKRYRDENDDGGFERIVGFVLYDEANIYARKEKAARLGYSAADEFFYAKATIEDLLSAMFDRDAWMNPPTEHGNARSGRALNEGNNWLATLADIGRAYDLLDEKDRQVLALKFKHDISRTKLSEMWQLSPKGADHRVESAVKRLWRNLGGPKWLAPEERERSGGTIGQRRVISNAHARAITDNQYEVGT